MPGRWLAIASVAAVLLAILAAFLLVGGPGTARLERLDERRAADLDALVTWIERYRLREGRLPESLGALEPTLPGEVSALDPVTGAHYGYEPLEEGRFRVCATLAIPDKRAPERRPEGRRIGKTLVVEPVYDPTGRQLCLQTAGLSPASD